MHAWLCVSTQPDCKAAQRGWAHLVAVDSDISNKGECNNLQESFHTKHGCDPGIQATDDLQDVQLIAASISAYVRTCVTASLAYDICCHQWLCCDSNIIMAFTIVHQPWAELCTDGSLCWQVVPIIC